ncbi:hypothetical protein KGF57_002976 [Candida theae]|uniref:candidapepsin n=1 Tax=Candida theae TaxID=1198502 RepID=A0AAD5BEK1_9ASCO|nr:uncharacterized protein KGF57_002976 [Candida theae]KAI5957710.1 hypothetical protein KGF57_002976 [Candida theae]
MVLIGSFGQKISIALSCALACNAAPVEKRSDKVVQFGFSVRRDEGGYEFDRRDYFSSDLKNERSYYGIEIEVGSNKEKSNLLFDTGSSDTWVVDANAVCVGVKCKDHGVYSVENSTTGKQLHKDFRIHYGDDTSANGTYVTDTIRLGNITVKNSEFAVANSTSSEFGVLGIGFTTLEQTHDNSTYDNLPITLKKEGYINKVAYSLYLNSPTSKEGSILFGGVDNAKYHGELVDVPIVSNTDLEVELDSITIEGKKYFNQSKILLDVGSTWSYLPTKLFKAIAKKTHAKYDHILDAYVSNCHHKGNVTFNFANNAAVEAPLSSFFVTVATYNSYKRSEDNRCVLGIFGDDEFFSFGDNFLRNAYVKYDLEDKTIGLATVRYTNETSIEAL